MRGEGGEQLAIACIDYIPLDFFSFFFFLIKMRLTGFKLHREDAVSVGFIWRKKSDLALCPGILGLSLGTPKNRSLCELFGREG